MDANLVYEAGVRGRLAKFSIANDESVPLNLAAPPKLTAEHPIDSLFNLNKTVGVKWRPSPSQPTYSPHSSHITCNL